MNTTDTLPLAQRITQSKMHAFTLSDYLIIGKAPPAPGAHIAKMTTHPDMAANAELITEAFNVTHDTGKTPRQLADENEKLKLAMMEIAKRGANPMTEYGYGANKPWTRLADDVWKIARDSFDMPKPTDPSR